MRSSAPRKAYALNQSPLFRLRGKGRFEDVIGVKWESVTDLLAAESFRVWKGPKDREIQAPIHWMAAVHKVIADLLARIEVPDYVFSQKGRSYADNARQHLGNHPVIKTDINKFYPSVTRAMVFRMFVRDFECAADVADRLADICCYRQLHLPTGSPLSGRVAFFAARGLFEDIAKLAAASDCKLTIYVDDIALSGPNATKRLLGEVRMLIARHGLKSKGKKSATFAAGAPKSVTGAVIVGDELRLPNERHRKLHETRSAYAAADGDERAKLGRQLRGRQQEAAQILRPVTRAT
ncbi:RNA-directed DNA polymerase [Ideonella sp. B7]|uniref:reverse transcriptase family protein n=1 Tax=Ideonella benzenivorans TaxID=2831643 RepID=UPI001CED7760|nr:reverse transcriptase family protein [Ideonella benzenivorans]MCA6218362.1 RNA-directed DNA polymerase [Ideonella benzenivorans]